MKTLIVAEKSSVAEDIAKALGGFSRKGPVWERDDVIVANARGHLVGLHVPEAEGRARGLQGLPVLPQAFELEVLDGNGDLFRTLKDQLSRSDVSRVVNACDAGREGELIFRLVYEKARCSKPMSRMWIQTMTQDGLREAYDMIKPGRDYDPLYDAARSRAEADWLVGINGTRGATALAMEQMGVREQFNVGRVQTPTLAIVVDHVHSIATFKPQTFWEIGGVFSAQAGMYKGLWRGNAAQDSESTEDISAEEKEAAASRVFDQAAARSILEKVQGCPVDRVEESAEPKKQLCPKLFDLTSLQREANKRFKFSAKKTLDLAQRLYEHHKVATYPRTDASALPEDYVQTAIEVMRKLEGSDWGKLAKPVTDAGWIGPNKRIFDNTKISDHFAIIPTGVISDQLSQDERLIFELIVRRFIAVFYPAAEFMVTKRVTYVAGEAFHSSGKVLLEAGWMAVLRDVDEDGAVRKAGEQVLCAVEPGEIPNVSEITMKEGKTSPPGRMTEGKLLSAMETAGRLVEDDLLREAMKEKGLGTPATRAATIEGLLDDGKARGRIKEPYLVRDGNYLEPTKKGVDLVNNLRAWGAGFLTSAQTTGEWEACLGRMASGEFPREAFMSGVRETADGLIALFKEKAKDTSGLQANRLNAPCPACHAKVMAMPGMFRCEAGCGWEQLRQVAARNTTDEEMTRLLKGETLPRLEGFFSPKKKRKFAAGLVMREGKMEFDFDGAAQVLDTNCPKCDGEMELRQAVVECKECKFKVWRKVCGRELTEADLEALLSKGKTGLLKGFVSNKTGKKFEASLNLSLSDGKVELVFPNK